MQITWTIPPQNPQNQPTIIELTDGLPVFIVRANGSEKSNLVTQLSKVAGSVKTLRIAAHRQSWLNSGSVDLTPKGRMDLKYNIDNRDRQDDSRWKDDFAQPRSQVALFDLANAQNAVSRVIHEPLKLNRDDEAKSITNQPSPLEVLNDILAVSTLIVCHQMIWDYFGFDLVEDWSHLIVDDYAAAFR